MELRPASHVILGMLWIGARSGYEIRRTAELSLRYIWAVSPRQIYDELKALEQAGLVAGKDDPKGSMKRRVFELTPAGRETLAAWVNDDEVGSLEWRDLGLVKLFFADVISDGDRAELFDRLRDRAEEMRDYFDETVVPAAVEQGSRHNNEMPELTARFARDFWTWMNNWLEEAESGNRSDSSPRSE